MLLREVGSMLSEKLLFVENIDATVIAQAPKLRPYIDRMRQKSGTGDVSLSHF